jgi:hypothetical protein
MMKYAPARTTNPLSPLGQAAEAYAVAGWWIFPIKPKGKTPMTAHGLKDATSDPGQVRAWWAQTPEANIGLNCGKSGLVAIDLDKHGADRSPAVPAGQTTGDGLSEWQKLAERHGLPPATATSLTGGGRHLLFAAPPDVTIKNSAGRLAPGIDVRGEGGYIVLPPSIHPSGAAYQWETATRTAAPLPDALIHILTTEPDPWTLYTLHDALQPRPPLVWLVDRILPMGSLSIWFGAPGSLKSLILADLAVCVAAGLPWLANPQNLGGFRTTAGGVLWLDFDNGARRTHERFGALAKAYRVAPSIPLYYTSMPEPPLDAGDPAAMGALAQRLVDRNIRLAIIDNLGLVKGASDENTDQMQAPMKGLRWLTEATGAAVCVIHHQRKTNGTSTRAGETLRGHSSIESALDLALHVDREEQDITLTSAKDRGFRIEPFGATFSYENDDSRELASARFWPCDPEAADDKAQLELENDVTAYLGKHPNLSATQIYNHLGGNRKKLFDTLRAMKELGQLAEKQGPGTSRLLYVP